MGRAVLNATTLDLTKLTPCQDRVLVRRLEDDRYKTRLIIVPDVAKEPSWKGEVIAVGPGLTIIDERTGEIRKIPLDVKVGDIIAFTGKWNDLPEIYGDEVALIQENDIMFIYHEKD